MIKWDAQAVAYKVAQALGLEVDLVVSEVETADSRAEAIRRLKSIKRDVETALDVVVRG